MNYSELFIIICTVVCYDILKIVIRWSIEPGTNDKVLPNVSGGAKMPRCNTPKKWHGQLKGAAAMRPPAPKPIPYQDKRCYFPDNYKIGPLHSRGDE